jgi:hypothetical protein
MINKAQSIKNDELKASPGCDQSSANDLGDDLSGPSDNPHQEDPQSTERQWGKVGAIQ